MKKGLALVLVLVMAMGLVGSASAAVITVGLDAARPADLWSVLWGLNEEIGPNVTGTAHFNALTTLGGTPGGINAGMLIEFAAYVAATRSGSFWRGDWYDVTVTRVASTNPVSSLFTDRGASIDQTMYLGWVPSGIYTDRGAVTEINPYPFIVEVEVDEIDPPSRPGRPGGRR